MGAYINCRAKVDLLGLKTCRGSRILVRALLLDYSVEMQMHAEGVIWLFNGWEL